MEVNFDLILAGCNTQCMHCYVNGGPGPLMPTDDALKCIERLDELASALPYPASFTLDNEPFNHPDIAAIIRAASSTRHISYFHHGMTTGIALMRRNDRDAVIRAYFEAGYDEFGITLHGSPAHHDAIVRRNGACRTALEAAEYMKACGARISVSLMLNRFFREDAEEIDRALVRLDPASVYFAVPNYTPHARMPEFEACRASLDDLRALAPWLARWRQDVDECLCTAGQHTVGAAAERLAQGLSLRALFQEEQQEQYLTVHQDGRLYMGNTGTETFLLGDLKTVDIARTADRIRRSPGNRDYGAFYDISRLPDEEALLNALRQLPAALLYSDLASVLYRGLAELGIPTKIIACPA